MSVRVAARRLALSGPSPLPRPAHFLPPPRATLPRQPQRRHKWSLGAFKGWASPGSKAPSDASSTRVAPELDDPAKRDEFLRRNAQGSAKDSIFQDEIDGPAAAALPPARRQQEPPEHKTRETMAMVTDPDPRSRVRWLRKKVIQMVRRDGALSRDERLLMTERQLLHKSHFLPTSLKKLVMLSRQIAGKSVDDAITQMKWSKKKIAVEVGFYLEEARDLAIAQRGMGLGRVNGELFSKPRKIKTRDGKWLDITDPTRIYIAQSWVGRGPFLGKRIDYKGRGRMGLIKHPSTSFTVVLKEEKSRIREYEESEAKKAAKGPWVHLPDRPIHGQRPYYTW